MLLLNDDDEGFEAPSSQSFPGSSQPIVAQYSRQHKYSEAGMLGYSSHDPHTNLTIMIATPHTISDKAWYLDNGAIAYMTNDASKLVHAQPYDGPGRVVIGDCRSILIS